MTARSCMKDFKSLLDPIDALGRPAWFACPPTWSTPEVALLAHWKKYVAWELANPLQFEDRAKVRERVVYAFKCALQHLRHLPEMWYLITSLFPP